MRTIFAPIYLIVAATILSAPLSNAQTVIGGDFEEGYSGNVAVSGRVIVGAMLGSSAGKVDPSQIQLPISQIENDTNVCFSATTRDGVYWARANLTIPADATPPVRMKPDDGWQYQQRVSKYDRADFSALALGGDDCKLNHKAPIIPLRYDSTSDDLAIMINSQRAFSVSATIETGSETPITSVCERSDSSSIRSTAFNVTCVFDLSEHEITGDHILSIDRRLRIGNRRDTFRIRLD